jgi:hypothetical protein
MDTAKGAEATAVQLNNYQLAIIASNIVISRLCKAERPGFENSVNVLFMMRSHIHNMLVLPAEAGIQCL